MQFIEKFLNFVFTRMYKVFHDRVHSGGLTRYGSCDDATIAKKKAVKFEIYN